MCSKTNGIGLQIRERKVELVTIGGEKLHTKAEQPEKVTNMPERRVLKETPTTRAEKLKMVSYIIEVIQIGVIRRMMCRLKGQKVLAVMLNVE